MDLQRMKRPSPAMVVATAALFFALGGTAGAVVTAAVPLAKRALVADTAKVATTAKTANTAKVANLAKVAKVAKVATTATRATTANSASTATTATTATTAANANQLGGSTKDQVIAAATTAGRDAALAQSPPGARSPTSAVGLVSLKTTEISLEATEVKGFTISCAPGQRALGGGYSSFDFIVGYDSFPANDPPTGWTLLLANATDPPAAANADIYVTCIG